MNHGVTNPVEWDSLESMLNQGLVCAIVLIAQASGEVVLDLIVRDKRGRAVKDLTAADIAIHEGSKAYTSTGVRQVMPETAGLSNTEPATAKPIAATLRQVRLVTFLFEPLPRESARLAKARTGPDGPSTSLELGNPTTSGSVVRANSSKETAQELVAKANGPNVFNVLLAHERMQILQPFTNDPKLLGKAIQSATGTAGFRDVDDMAKLAEQNLKRLALNQQDFEQLMRGQLPQSRQFLSMAWTKCGPVHLTPERHLA